MPKPFYAPPTQLPGGFWETQQPLADWLLCQLRAAYDAGYTDGRVAASVPRSELDVYFDHMRQTKP